MLYHVLKSVTKYHYYASVIVHQVKSRISLVKEAVKMYNNSGFSGYFGGPVQNVGPMPMHSGVMNNPRMNRSYFMENGGMNMFCSVRKVLCGELRLPDAGSSVEICGRIQNQRLGRFLSLRDDTGITQLVVPDDRIDLQKRLRNMPLNSFLVLRGFVTARPEKSRNEKMATGDVEVLIENLVTVHPKRKRDESDTDEEDVKRPIKKNSTNSACLKLTSEELSKCPTPALIKFFSQRSHTCGELSKRLVGKSITLCGWVSAKRVGRFVMLKDGYGSVQIVPELQNVALTDKFQNLHLDSILVVKGVVSRRPPGHENPRVENGNIEILVDSLSVINPHDPPSPPEEDGDGGDSGNKKEPVPPNETQNEIEPVVPNSNKFANRTHTCGELSTANVGQKVCLVGWVEFSRMKKFILLRDRYGKTQLIIPETKPELQDLVDTMTLQSVIEAEGTVCSRPPGQENTKQVTGAIEVSVTNLKLLNKCKVLPFDVNDFNKTNEYVRMKYRYLNLRFDNMQHNLRLRCQTVHKMRKYLIEHLDFIEIETPTLFRRTPGGAQEFIVPTVFEGKYYSLVQSPQQFKQLLMVGSADRYFQFARCYRDETSEINRQPEFTQLDLEMSFCDREGVINLIEELLEFSWPDTLPPISIPFPRITYKEAMERYGSDKPDLRFDWKIEQLTDLFTENKDKCKGKIKLEEFLSKEDFGAYAFVGRQGAAKFSNDAKKKFVESLKELYPSLSFIFMPIKSLKNSLETLGQLFCAEVAEGIEKQTNYDPEDVLFLALGSKTDVLNSLGRTRVNFAEFLEEKKCEVYQKNAFKFLWVVDFPLFEENETIASAHHPFTQPHPEDVHLLESDPLKVRSLHYDLVLNGNEIGGGSIRIHDSELQSIVLEKILKIDREPLAHLLEAFESGAPPHGGIALGLDRLIALMCGTKSIRDVIAFPKGHLGKDPMSNAPCDITEAEKIRYHLKPKS